MVRLMAGLLLAWGLAGCATSPPVPPGALDRAASANWTFQGRVGIKTADDSLSGQLHWQHRPDRDELLMTSPLGQGVARIERNAQGVTLDVPNQPARYSLDAESLTRDVLGYGLPVSGLAWWVQAQPAPGRAFEITRRDAAGRIEQLKQDGWVIDYLQYVEDQPLRPRKLVVARDGLVIRLVADSWRNE